MSQYHFAQNGRTAAILTTGEVAGFAVKLERAQDSRVTVDLSFTIGSLTNVTVRVYASMDNTTYDLITGPTGQEMEFVLTASTETCIIVPPLDGWKWMRVSLQGAGTLTNSTAQFTYRALERGSQR